MRKFLIAIIFFLFFYNSSSGQASANKMIFFIDSIAMLNDPEDWNPILPEDIADMNVIRNKDSLKLLGWEEVEGITYIFTKAYRNRPDSVKRIPSLKQLVWIAGIWNMNGVPYSGRYIDYYNSGRIQDEGNLLYGKLDGELIIYFKNGNRKSVAHYKDGVAEGIMQEYYKNGALFQSREFAAGKVKRGYKIYFINGNIQHEIRLKKDTRFDTAVSYYSTGKVSAMKLTKTDDFTPGNKESQLNYYTNLFYRSLAFHDMRNANKYFYKLWRIDSGSASTHFKEGMLFINEIRFDEAIAAFNKALEIEPLMKESMLHRGLARIRKYQGNTQPLSKQSKEIPLTMEDLLKIPAEEQKKICQDLNQADDLDPTDNYVRKLVPSFIRDYCREAKER